MSEKEHLQTIKCPCGSTIKNISVNRHNNTKKHLYFLEKGEILKRDNNKYQRQRLASNPELREKQRKICKEYYENNKENIHERHKVYREERRKTRSLKLKKNCECECHSL